MSKLVNWLRRIDDNLLHITFIAFIVLVSLLPKYPIQHVEYTYIKIRIDDILPVILGFVFFAQWIRGRVKLNLKMAIPIVLFWLSVFASFIYGFYIIKTIREPVFNVGLLHALRRVEYMFIFFVAAATTISDKRFYTYLKWYFATLAVVIIYGIGQRVPFQTFTNSSFCLPSIQSMNPAYVDGRLLCLSFTDRINSTFGGHFDLAAYLTYSIPIIIGYAFYSAQLRYTLLFVVSLLALLYTSARSSFGAFVSTTFPFIFLMRKFKYLLFAVAITGLLLLTTQDMAKRFAQTFQLRTVFVNTQSGSEQVSQKITVDNLPAGNQKLKVPQLSAKTTAKPKVSDVEIQQAALNDVVETAKQNGEVLTAQEAQRRAQEIAQFIQPQQLILCDISCSTRLQVEWPRALGAFLASPVLGTGPYSLGEATDNDILRWLGEFGIVGTSIFLTIIALIMKAQWKLARKFDHERRYVYYGMLAGTFALLINALYIDIFEASKLAYNFWLLSGMTFGLLTYYEKKSAPLAKQKKAKKHN